MNSSAGFLFAAAILGASPVFAQSAAMSVGARVAPQCRISVDSSTLADGVSPGVRVACGRAGLRALRVTSDRGGSLQPIATIEGRQMRAGGEVAFVIARPLATVASLQPSVANDAAGDRRPVLVTLDF